MMSNAVDVMLAEGTPRRWSEHHWHRTPADRHAGMIADSFQSRLAMEWRTEDAERRDPGSGDSADRAQA
jgi:hypothetical protein